VRIDGELLPNCNHPVYTTGCNHVKHVATSAW